MIDRERKRQADRARRARIKAGTWEFPNGGAADFAKAGTSVSAPRDALKSSRGPTKPAVFAPAPRRVEKYEATSAPCSMPPAPHPVAPAPSRALVAVPAPPSMTAIGGRPGRGLVSQGSGYPAPPDLAAVSPFTRAEEFRAKTETMLATLAAKADAQDRRIAALEAAAADRRADALNVVQALAGLFRYAISR